MISVGAWCCQVRRPLCPIGWRGGRGERRRREEERERREERGGEERMWAMGE